MQGLFSQKAGWKYAEKGYMTRLEADFSASELQELLNLSKKPVMKKLLRAEMKAYLDGSQERRKLLNKLWDDWNSGAINAPAEILR